MPRFDVYKNPNPKGAHVFYLDVQSDLVTTATRWCIPLRTAKPGQPMVNRAQGLVTVQGVKCLLDTPNLLAVPNALLKNPVDRLEAAAQVLAEATVEFMLRGY
jgi:toxin CcdB